MKTWKYVIPVVTIAIGFWACGDDKSASAETCLTEECLQNETADPNNPADTSGLNFSDPMSSSIGGDPTSSAVVDPNLSSVTDPASSAAVGPASSATGEVPASSADVLPGSSANVPSVGSSSSVGPVSSATVNPSSSSVQVVASSSSIPVAAEPAFKEDHRDECTIGDIPSSVNNAKLPDPFKMLNGTVISTKDQWKCRREEIGAMYEKLMFGAKPRNPEKVEGSISGKTFTVKVTDKGKSASFTVEISGAGTKDKPKPAMIGFGGGMMGNSCGSLGGSLSGLDIAQIIFNPDNVAPEGTRGSGKFYDIYGSGNEAGTIMAWAWGVSRLIDALEKTPEAGIDVHHLGMTGCSRWGKGSLAVGAFDERIALTIPQESGSGGASLWRVGAQVNKQKGKQFVQGLNSAGSEGNWMRTSFKNYDGKENTLPFDQHMLVDMVAPRALLILDNAGQEWLGEVPSNYCGQAAKEVFDALGATENYTYSQEGGHGHCQLPNGQFDEVKDFINKFLLGKDAKTGKIDYTKNTEQIKWNKSEWIDWTTPSLK